MITLKRLMSLSVLLLFVFASQFFSSTSAYAAGGVALNNNDVTSLYIIVPSSAVGTNFLTFIDSGTTTASSVDLAKVAYDGLNPTAGIVVSSSLLRFTFPISMGTDKSGGPFTIDANTFINTSSTPNSSISVANGSIADSAHPEITAASIASDGADPAYAKVGDTVTVTFTTTEDLDTSLTERSFTTEGGNPVFDDTYALINTSGTTWEFSYVTDADDIEGAVEFSILPADLGGQQDIIYITDTTDSSAVTFDKTAPIISEITPVTTPTTDDTPSYTFTTDDSGTITYGGSCSSASTSATSGSNTISFTALANGAYSDCTIIVSDTASNESNTIAVTVFTIASSVPTVTIASDSGFATQSSPISVTVTFSETVTGFTLGDISITRGVGQNFLAVSGTEYTFDIIPSTYGNVRVSIDADVAQDSASNGNDASSELAVAYQKGGSGGGGGGYNSNIEDRPGGIQTVEAPEAIPSSCAPYLTSNLKFGQTGDDIKKLQQFLNSHGVILAETGAGSPGNETTIFGSLTRAAVAAFQEKYSSDILVPAGLTSGSGFAGPMTLKKINELSCV